VDTLQLIINKVNHQYLSEEESSSKIAARSNVFHFMMSTVFGENHSKIGSVKYSSPNLSSSQMLIVIIRISISGHHCILPPRLNPFQH
jgi:hypothetical protein